MVTYCVFVHGLKQRHISKMDNPSSKQGLADVMINEHHIALLQPDQQPRQPRPPTQPHPCCTDMCQKRWAFALAHVWLVAYGLSLYFLITFDKCKGNCDALLVRVIVSWIVVSMPLIFFLCRCILPCIFSACSFVYSCYVSAWREVCRRT